MRVGFIGIGNMGWPMAACLLRAGFDLSVHRQPAPSAPPPSRARSAARRRPSTHWRARREAIITMLPTSAIVAEVLDAACCAGLRPGALVIEMTSGVPAITRDLARRRGGGRRA